MIFFRQHSSGLILHNRQIRFHGAKLNEVKIELYPLNLFVRILFSRIRHSDNCVYIIKY